jgi:hypothetical protein
MICKFFRTGKSTKSASKQINYLLNERVENETAKCVYGNPELTKKIIFGIENEYKFSAGVMSFEEHINQKQRDEIIEHFKKTFFCGLDENQYNLLVVEHQDKNRSELHFIIPRLELKNGLAYNPFFHTRDFKKKDLFQDFINAKYNFTSPHQIEKKEIFKINTSNKKELQAFVDNFVKEELEKGTISNADDLKKALNKLGFSINRHGKNYVSLEIENQKFRMKGEVYGKDFRDITEVRRKQEELQAKHIPRNSREFAKIEQKLEEIISYQAKQNHRKYNRIKHNYSDIDIDKHSNISHNEQVASETAREIRRSWSKVYNTQAKQDVPDSRQTETLQNRRVKEDDELRNQINRIIRRREARESERAKRVAYYAAYNRKATRTDTRSIAREYIKQQRLQRDRRSLRYIAQEFFSGIKNGIVKVITHFKKPIEAQETTLKQNMTIDTLESDLRAYGQDMSDLQAQNWDELVKISKKANKKQNLSFNLG